MQEIIIEPTKKQIREISFKTGQQACVFEYINNESTIDEPITTHVHIGDNSQIEYIYFLDSIDQLNEFSDTRVIEVGENSRVNSYYIITGVQKNTIDLWHKISATAHYTHNVLLIGTGEQSFEIDEKYNFLSTNAYGRFNVNTLLSDKAFVNYVGNIVINPGAQKTDSNLKMQSYLLSTNAQSNMVPSLEIEANDVKAGHSGTISRLDSERLFYLMSRGLTKSNAEQLYINGVIDYFLGAITMVEIKDKIHAIINKKVALLHG